MSIQAAIFIPVVLALRLETSREKLLGTCRMTGKGKDVGELILLCAWPEEARGAFCVRVSD